MHDPDPKDQAQTVLDGCGIEPGQVYRHYKGGLYVIVAVAIDEASLEPMVVYRSNRRGTTWIRTLANFIERIKMEVGGGFASHHVPRFHREAD
jgi:hypothetical protein